MIELHGPKSEEATLHEANGIETDPILDTIAKSRGIDLKRLLKTLKMRPDDLTEIEQRAIIEYSSAILPKKLERKMIDMYRNDRDHLNLLLFNHNARAATKLATVYNNKYARTAINKRYFKEDFLSSARYGLWMGAIRFDIDRTFNGEPIKFITFATPWMFRYISEMMYEKVNMIPHQSLDAKAYQDSDTTLGELISEKDLEDYDEDEDVDDEPDMTIFDDDEENIEMEETDDSLLSSLKNDLSTITGPGIGIDEEREIKAGQDYDELKEMSKAEEISDRAISAITKLCKTALELKDPQERTIVLFIGRKYIQAAVKKNKGMELPQEIRNAHSMLKGIPASKKRLLECLHLSQDDFNKLCRHYTTQFINADEDPVERMYKSRERNEVNHLTKGQIEFLVKHGTTKAKGGVGDFFIPCRCGAPMVVRVNSTVSPDSPDYHFWGCSTWMPGGGCNCHVNIDGTRGMENHHHVDRAWVAQRAMIVDYLNEHADELGTE